MNTTTILCPTGHLGFTPLEKGSFLIGCEKKPDYIIADSGSSDIGPYPLGADSQASPVAWQKHDLEIMLVQARKLGVPMIIGSACDTGTNRGVDLFVKLIKEIAAEHKLAPFKLGYVYSEVPVAKLKEAVKGGRKILGLDGRAEADMATLDGTNRCVAVMGPEVIEDALKKGVDVLICGRTSDPAIFAAPLRNKGYSKAISVYAGKVMECASFCAEPFMGKESILGTIEQDAVLVEPMHPGQRCTPASVAGHAMYERVNPFREYIAGGYCDMTNCNYVQHNDRTTKITGATFVEDKEYKVKLEGAGKTGERRLSIVGIRDPKTITYLDKAIAWAKEKLVERFGPMGENEKYNVFYHLYGRNAVMEDLDPTPNMNPHEVGIVVEVVCKDAELATEICALASRNIFYARLPEVKGTAGAAALMSDEILVGKPAYVWTLNHVIAVKDPFEFHSFHQETVGG